MSCLYCGRLDSLGVDHLIPKSRGGLEVPENILKACRRCNASKSDRLPSEWRVDLPSSVYELEKRALSVHPKVLPRRRNQRAQKDEVVNVRMTIEQKKLLEPLAAKEGLGLSTWLLRLGLVAANQESVVR